MIKKFIHSLLMIVGVSLLVSSPVSAASSDAMYWGPPYWSAVYVLGPNGNQSYNQLGCIGTATSNCPGQKIAMGDNREVINGTSGRNFVYFSMRNSAGNVPSSFQYTDDTYAIVSFNLTASQPASTTPTINLLGSSRRVKDSSSANFFPVMVLDRASTDLYIDSTYKSSQTLTVLYRNRNIATGGEPEFFQQLYVGGGPTTTLRITNVLFYNGINAVLDDINSGIVDVNTNLGDIRDILEKIQNSPNAGEVLQQQREQDKELFDDAQSDVSSSGDDSGAQATSQGQTLLEAFTSFVGIITNAQPSNCNITMDTGFINFGVVNLCSLKPPAAFQVISSIVVIGFAVPLSLAAAKKMIELFRSFQT